MVHVWGGGDPCYTPYCWRTHHHSDRNWNDASSVRFYSTHEFCVVDFAGETGDGCEAAGETGDSCEAAGETGDGCEAAGETGDGCEAAGETGDGCEAAGETGDGCEAAGETGDGCEIAGETGDGFEVAGGIVRCCQQSEKGEENIVRFWWIGAM